MKDKLGQEIQVGDWGCTIMKGYRELTICKVVKITEKSFKVEYKTKNRNKNIQYQIKSSMFIKLDQEQVSFLIMSGEIN